MSNEIFRENIYTAYNTAPKNCFDLMQIYEDQDPNSLLKHGVKVDTARPFVCDINFWVKRCKETTYNKNLYLV